MLCLSSMHIPFVLMSSVKSSYPSGFFPLTIRTNFFSQSSRCVFHSRAEFTRSEETFIFTHCRNSPRLCNGLSSSTTFPTVPLGLHEIYNQYTMYTRCTTNISRHLFFLLTCNNYTSGNRNIFAVSLLKFVSK